MNNILDKAFVRVMAVGDCHDDPHLNKDRFTHYGMELVKNKPPVFIQIGDWVTLDSLNTHIGNETLSGRKKPSWDEDMASLRKSLQAFKAPLDAYNKKQKLTKHKQYHPTLIITEGNHEYRSKYYGEKNPEVGTKLRNELKAIFEEFGFIYQPFKIPYTIGNTDFLHCPISVMGKPLGGENVANTAASKSIRDVVFGHTHKRQTITKPKLGSFNEFVTAIDLGSGMPDGHVEDYAKHNTTGWSWGYYNLLISKETGRIVSDKYTSAKELEIMYRK